MKGICWLASYPKSGNTWLRALLTNYRRNGDEPAAINDLDGGWTGLLRETFDECTGLESADLTPLQIEHYRPAMYECLAAASVETLFLKIHDAYSCNAGGEPIVSKQATAGVIYMIRNPLDVAVSYAHHRHEAVDDTIRIMSLNDAVLAGSSRPSNQLPQTVRSWSSHVTSWVDQPGLNVHVVRYEDLMQRPVAGFAGVIRFAGLDVDPDRLHKAVAFSSFARLQSQEAAHGFAERQPSAVSFFRRGRVGSWRESLTTAQARQLIADHRIVMHRFGYLSDSDELQC